MLDYHTVIKVERQGNTLIALPQADAAGSFRFAELHHEANAVYRLLDDPELVNLVLDLSGLDYSGTEMIGAIVRLARKVSDDGGRTFICETSEKMQEILTTMNLFKQWPYYSTREAALAALAE